MSQREPAAFPPCWACAWGDDAFGLWAEFEVGDQRQRMRWIEPGEGWMGSPMDEPRRSDEEGPRCRVLISEGFWLADTACTQALWMTVTRSTNPSRFSDDLQCPVEQVSWDDVQIFLHQLDEHSGFEALPSLPTEAEWEYACRAGTNTPFSFGHQISAERVNYDGTLPYGDGPRGLYRKRTVAVKALPANRWGLYQMHGNVWEWCADGPRTYAPVSPLKALVDPRGPVEPGGQALRAVRGGSWSFAGKAARSASRNACHPGDRRGDLSFRFALRS